MKVELTKPQLLQIRKSPNNGAVVGTEYIFFKDDNFHVIFTEKGKIRTHTEYNEIEDVLWDVLEIVLFDVAMDYALKNREQGKDFRY